MNRLVLPAVLAGCFGTVATAQSVILKTDEDGASIQMPGLSLGAGIGGDGEGAASLQIDQALQGLEGMEGIANITMQAEGNGSVTLGVGDGFDEDTFAETLSKSGGAVNLMINFESGSDALTPFGASQVEQVADALWDLDDDAVIVVEGHTDSVGSDGDNLDLSMRRATTVMTALLSQHEVDQKLVQRGKGESEPIATNDTSEGRALNRRVTFIRQ